MAQWVNYIDEIIPAALNEIHVRVILKQDNKDYVGYELRFLPDEFKGLDKEAMEDLIWSRAEEMAKQYTDVPAIIDQIKHLVGTEKPVSTVAVEPGDELVK